MITQPSFIPSSLTNIVNQMVQDEQRKHYQIASRPHWREPVLRVEPDKKFVNCQHFWEDVVEYLGYRCSVCGVFQEDPVKQEHNQWSDLFEKQYIS